MHRIMVVDHHPMVLSALVDIISEAPEMELAGAASTVQEAIDQVRQLLPDIVLLDMDMPGGAGAALAVAISGFHPQARLIPISALSDPAPAPPGTETPARSGPLAKTLVAPHMLKELTP